MWNLSMCLIIILFFCKSKKNCATTIEGRLPVIVVNLYWARGSNHQANHKPTTTELVIDFFPSMVAFFIFYVVKAGR
uniref:Secreted protein n=1 Tax=Anopheles darlingi TaxID=43151 RepID=A0A2M4DGE3_ANODA